MSFKHIHCKPSKIQTYEELLPHSYAFYGTNSVISELCT